MSLRRFASKNVGVGRGRSVGDVLDRLGKDRERATDELLQVALNAANGLPRSLREFGREAAGDVVFKLVDADAASLRAQPVDRGIDRVLAGRILGTALNTRRAERRERRRRECRATSTRRSEKRSEPPVDASPETQAGLFSLILSAARAAEDDGGLAARRLTKRQEQVLRGVKRGLGKDLIARELALTHATVRDHARGLLKKLLGPPRRPASAGATGARRRVRRRPAKDSGA